MVPFNGGRDTARDGALIVHLIADLIVHLMADLMELLIVN